MVNILDLLTESVKISGNPPKVTCPGDAVFDEWRFYRGLNTITNQWDVFVAFESKEDATKIEAKYRMYRWSGKNLQWQSHGNVVDPRDHLRSYDRATEVSKIFPQRSPKGSPVKASSLSVCNCECKCENSTKGKSGMSLSKVFGKFGKCSKGEFAMSIEGNVAIKRKDGGYSCLREGKLIDIDTLAVDVDAFYYMPVQSTQLVADDVVLVGNAGIGFVQKVNEDGGIEVYDVNNEVVSTIKPATHFLMPYPFVTKVVSLLSPNMMENNPLLLMLLMGKGKDGNFLDKGKSGSNLLPLMLLMGQGGLTGGKDGVNGMNPLLLMSLMGNKDNDISKLLPIMLLSQGKGLGATNPMLLFLMMQEGGLDDMLPLMLLSGGLGGCCCSPVPAKPA